VVSRSGRSYTYVQVTMTRPSEAITPFRVILAVAPRLIRATKPGRWSFVVLGQCICDLVTLVAAFDGLGTVILTKMRSWPCLLRSDQTSLQRCRRQPLRQSARSPQESHRPPSITGTFRRCIPLCPFGLPSFDATDHKSPSNPISVGGRSHNPLVAGSSPAHPPNRYLSFLTRTVFRSTERRKECPA
jgi:hypothetical protein